MSPLVEGGRGNSLVNPVTSVTCERKERERSPHRMERTTRPATKARLPMAHRNLTSGEMGV